MNSSHTNSLREIRLKQIGVTDSAEAITNVYPILQMFDLAFGRFPSAATLASMVDTGLTLPADSRPQLLARRHSPTPTTAGALIDPNSTANGRDR